jgi:hypothetical protein
MNAAQARSAVNQWHIEAGRENREYNRKRIAREKATAAAVWKERGDALVTKIDGWIAKASKDGKRGTYEPTDLNPNGDEVIWLKKAEQPIFELLMEHFRNEGFEVEEYQNYGMKITW